MEFRTDLVFSIPEYGGIVKGLLTLGESRIIQLENGQEVELLPFLLQKYCTRGVSKKDPRRRMRDDIAISLLAQAYADHFNNAGLDEHWTKEEVENMLLWHHSQSLGKLFFVKWAKDLDSGEEFPVGFYSAYSKPFQGGKMLWDTELFVLSEFRRYGIGTELVKAMFLTAKNMGIDLFESLTYKDESGHPLKMWEKFGATPSDLIHIFGNVGDMLSKTDINSEKNKSRSISLNNN